MRLIKTKDWEVKAHEPDILDPDHDPSQSLTLVLRSDHANCPKKVKRCEACKIAFSSEMVVIKSAGEREFTKKNGERVHQVGNIYLHYLTKCINQFKPNFKFSDIDVLKSTQNGLSKRNITELVRRGCKML